MLQAQIKIGPKDAGRRMTLAEFEHAEGQEGRVYELSRGVVVVVDVPNFKHLSQIIEARNQLDAFKVAHPEQIYCILGGMECKVLLADLQSERHPDLAIFKRPPDNLEDLWSTWIPEIIIEVVSLGSEVRDYVEKREEYFAFGVKEYWIFDAAKNQLLVLRRARGQWQEITTRPGETYETKLLPGFVLDCGKVLAAGQ